MSRPIYLQSHQLISCAYAAAATVEQLPAPVERLELKVDPGTFKNGTAVTVLRSENSKGNTIAAALGAVIAGSSPSLGLLKGVTPSILKKAHRLLITDYR